MPSMFRNHRLSRQSSQKLRPVHSSWLEGSTPVLEFYRDKLTTIDATQTPVKVINEITSVILSLGRAGARDNAHECTVQKRSENLVPS